MFGCVTNPAVDTSTGKPAVVSFYAEPSNITVGGLAVLHWAVKNAEEVEIEGIGSVALNGSIPVKPNTTTQYRLIAKGNGISVSATTTVVVYTPPNQSGEAPPYSHLPNNTRSHLR